MPDSVYKVIELVGTSTDSWEKAAAAASLPVQPCESASAPTSRATSTIRRAMMGRAMEVPRRYLRP